MPVTDNGDRTSKLHDLLGRVSDGNFRSSLGEMALCFLAWEVRLTRMETVAAGGKTGGWSRETLSELRQPYVDHFQSTHLNWTREDTENAFGLFRHCEGFVDWYRVVIASFGLKISFDAGLPQVPIDHARAWQEASNRVDPDAVVTLLFAEEGLMQDTAQLRDWPPITPIGANDFDEIMNRGIADLHVHMGGMRNAYIMWRKVVHEPDTLRFVPRYASRVMEKLLPEELNTRRRERDEIAALAEQLSARESGPAWENPLRRFWAAEERAPRRPRDEILAESATERLMLAQAWRRLLSAGEEHEKHKLEMALDRYLFTKSNFLKHHLQPETTNPGLGGFRRFFHSTQQAAPRKSRFSPARFEISPKFEARELAEYAAYIAQSRPLKRLELRIAPKDNPVDYHRFFSLWSKTEKAFGFSEASCDIRFAVHFKRSLKPKRDEDASAALLRFLCDLDRDSAQLHAYRRKGGGIWQKHVHRVSRVDFAGQERDLPVHLAALCMNLVRGRPSALKAIAESSADGHVHRFWRMHHARGEATQRVDRPRLGVTCHAGEDYAHPLEGLYSVASAVDLLEMSAGDTIGHGLALGEDIEKFNTRNRPARIPTRGNRFDALLWLLFELEQNDSAASSDEIVNLRNFLLDEVRDIYGAAAVGLHTLQDLRGLSAERIKAVAPCKPSAGAAARMRYAELTVPSCAECRAQPPESPNDLVHRLGPALKRVQARQLKNLSDKGIILEFNPSSNLRVSGSGRMADAPFVSILNLHSTVLATVNSDNPGVFGTRIENEFALVASALRDVGISRTETMAIIERLRKVGMETVYWPKSSRQAAGADDRAAELASDDGRTQARESGSDF